MVTLEKIKPPAVRPPRAADPSLGLLWKIDECAAYFDRLHVRGWCHHRDQEIRRVELVYAHPAATAVLASFGQPSPDVAAAIDPLSNHARFDEWIQAPAEALGQPFTLRFTLADGTVLISDDALTNAADGDPFFQSWENFLASLDTFPSGCVLEIGSRARSAITRRHRIPPRLDYLGLDILPGPNVGIVGDAHELSAIFPTQRFVAVFSTSVFEHLAMPWKVALEINRVLVPGGLVYTSSHQTWPLHEEPWDFWRYSTHTWPALFNAATGFAIVETVMGDPARIHARRTSTVTRDLPASPAYLGSASLARKISETTLAWPVPPHLVTAATYPAGELARPPTPNLP